MNLRDKLKAVDAPRRPAVKQPERQAWACWEGVEHRSLDEFPNAFELRRDTVLLMQGEAMPDPLDPTRILYLDTETTGLGGGAGTVAFLVGIGFLTPTGFEIHQYMMRDYPEERDLLEKLAETVKRFDVLCSFNGRTFDVPLLRDRFLMNRLSPACLDLPHIDLLHMARRVWKLRLKRCNLSHLEEAVLGYPRAHDLPGSEVPQRFFDFLKTGQFELLTDVLTHNAQDIATLCTLLSHMADMYEHPEGQTHEEDLFSMGASLEKLHHPEEARRLWHLASRGKMRTAGQLRIAQSWRRCGDRGAARSVWLNMILHHEGGVIPYIELAKYEEHVSRDVEAALDMTRQAIALLSDPTLTEDETVQATRNALQYRYDRLKRRRDRQKES